MPLLGKGILSRWIDLARPGIFWWVRFSAEGGQAEVNELDLLPVSALPGFHPFRRWPAWSARSAAQGEAY